MVCNESFKPLNCYHLHLADVRFAFRPWRAQFASHLHRICAATAETVSLQGGLLPEAGRHDAEAQYRRDTAIGASGRRLPFRRDESVNQHFRYPQDFDQNRYRAYLQAAGIRVQARPEDLLASLDAAVPAAAGISLRQGGVLFFAREPQRFVLFRARYVERVGSGIPRIRQALQENGNPPMEISASSFFVVTFRPRLETESPLSARQSRLFHFVAERTRTTKEEAATFLAVSGDTALRELRVLRDAGLVERGGVGKAAFYQRARHRPG
ncbi:MAG: hypothetical protein OXC12_00875 [Spirochaetaceae bacterium]|nr:hypothetical protein [Spirochaetaceae bacterium]